MDYLALCRFDKSIELGGLAIIGAIVVIGLIYVNKVLPKKQSVM